MSDLDLTAALGVPLIDGDDIVGHDAAEEALLARLRPAQRRRIRRLLEALPDAKLCEIHEVTGRLAPTEGRP